MEGVRVPRQQRGKESFERLLDAAEELLGDEGFAGFTIAGLQKRGISNGAIYWRVDSMDSLFVAVHERFLARIAAHHAATYGDPEKWEGLSLGESVRQAVLLMAETFRQHGRLLRALVMREATDAELHRRGNASVRAAERQFVSQVAPRIDAEIGDGELRAEIIFRAVFGALVERVAWPDRSDMMEWSRLVSGLCDMAVAYAEAPAPARHSGVAA